MEIDHPLFNKEYYEFIKEQLIEMATEAGLEKEVVLMFNDHIKGAFNGNYYPLTLAQYQSIGNHVLYEWDI